MPRYGKIIDRWKFLVQRMEIEVPVRMLATGHSSRDTTFTVDFTYGEHSFDQQNTDINELRRDVEKWLRGIVTFDYNTYYYVTVSGRVSKPMVRNYRHVLDKEHIDELNSQETGELGMHLEWRMFQVGTSATGIKKYRDCSKTLNMGNWTDGEPYTGSKDNDVFEQGNPSVSALVPATPENAAALNRIADAFANLQARLMQFLSPDQIEGSLAKLASQLPAMLSHDGGDS